MENIKIDILETKPCSVLLSIEIPTDEVKSETSKIYDDIQKNARIPGFRIGKAPLDAVKKNFEATAREKVVESLIGRHVFQALKGKSIEPISYPKIEEVNFDFDKPLKFKVKAEKHPEFKLKGYKGIKIVKTLNSITDEKVSQSLETMRDRNSSLIESENGLAGDKSFVSVDYEAFSDGSKVENMTAKNQMIDLSSPQTLAGFKEGLAGSKKGDMKEVNVTFPKEHPNKALQGKEVVFKITVNQIKEKQLPALDDEFAKDFSLSSLDELKVKIKENLELEEKNRQNREVEQQLTEALLKDNEFPVPDSLKEEQTNFLLSKAADYYRSQGMPESAWGKSVAALRDKYKVQAEKDVRLSYIFDAILKEEKIAVSEDDMKKELDKLHESNKGREKEIEKYFTDNKERIAAHLKESKLFDFLISQAKVKEEVKK